MIKYIIIIIIIIIIIQAHYLEDSQDEDGNSAFGRKIMGSQSSNLNTSASSVSKALSLSENFSKIYSSVFPASSQRSWRVFQDDRDALVDPDVSKLGASYTPAVSSTGALDRQLEGSSGTDILSFGANYGKSTNEFDYLPENFKQVC